MENDWQPGDTSSNVCVPIIMSQFSGVQNSAEPLEESAALRVDADMQVPISYSPEVRPDSPVVDGHATQLSVCIFLDKNSLGSSGFLQGCRPRSVYICKMF